MKKKVFQYSIAEPCHESWEAMTPTQQGRFCDSCAKSVVDFTCMTDAQVLHYMSNAKGSVCGRLTNFQLHRDFTQYEMGRTRSFDLRALVLGTALTTFSALNTHAQGEVETFPGDMAVEQVGRVQRVMQDTIVMRDTVFSGTTVDYLGDGFVGMAVVTVYDANGNELETTLTNEAGEFQLPLIAAQNPYSIVFRKEEYDEVVYLLADLTLTRGITVKMIREVRVTMGKMILIEPEEPKTKAIEKE